MNKDITTRQQKRSCYTTANHHHHHHHYYYHHGYSSSSNYYYLYYYYHHRHSAKFLLLTTLIISALLPLSLQQQLKVHLPITTTTTQPTTPLELPEEGSLLTKSTTTATIDQEANDHDAAGDGYNIGDNNNSENATTTTTTTTTPVPLPNPGKLMQHVMTNYSKEQLPSKPVIVHFNILLIKVKSTVEKDGIFESVVALFIQWSDHRFIWDPSDYYNITELTFSYDKVWLPDIAMLNAADHMYTISKDTSFLIRATYRGLFDFVPIGTAKTWCDLKLLTFPFDLQTCSLEFESWSLSSGAMQFSNASRVVIDPSFSSTQFYLCSHKTVLYDYYYEMTDETFSRLRFDLTVRRKSTFYMLNLIFPIAILSAVQPLSFFLPMRDASSDRIGFGTTNMLTLVVFQTIVTAEMPRTSDAVTVLSKYIGALIILSATGIMESVLVERLLRISSRAPPGWLSKFFAIICPITFQHNVPLEELYESKPVPPSASSATSPVTATAAAAAAAAVAVAAVNVLPKRPADSISNKLRTGGSVVGSGSGGGEDGNSFMLQQQTPQLLGSYLPSADNSTTTSQHQQQYGQLDEDNNINNHNHNHNQRSPLMVASPLAGFTDDDIEVCRFGRRRGRAASANSSGSQGSAGINNNNTQTKQQQQQAAVLSPKRRARRNRHLWAELSSRLDMVMLVIFVFAEVIIPSTLFLPLLFDDSSCPGNSESSEQQ